ncbi:MAG: hypothetical protein CM15mP117_15000 [Alphaproteobacteria bacterium]|nr:MAG: hypothetical protein CM15mP117_15000 [Alphaproteobacteria bacterium]
MTRWHKINDLQSRPQALLLEITFIEEIERCFRQNEQNFERLIKGRIHGNSKGGTQLNFGSYGLKAVSPERITARQIEAARRAITRHLRRAGRVWIRIFPDVPVSSKPAEVRMGKGKGITRILGGPCSTR